MKTKTLPKHISHSVTQLLQPYCSELTPEGLLKALREYNSVKTDSTKQIVSPTELLKVSSFCEKAKCSRSTVFRLIKTGKIPKVMLGTRSLRIPESAVINLIEGGI